ncbi:putative vitellogenin receptor, partial [Nephila pilipes]
NGTECRGFRCNDNSCIPAKWKCDGQTDCSDGSDEELCPKSDVCTGVDCSQKCRATSRGPECYCDDGYSLDSDNKTCSDINECLIEGFCSQQCTNLVGSYKCSCLEGFVLVNGTCEASASEPVLIFSNLNEIRAFYLRTERYVLVQKAVYEAASLDADPLESKVYWIEVSNRSSVYASKVDGTGFSVILNNGLLVPEDIAVDYVARNFYLTDSGLKQVLACKMDGSMCHTLHYTNVEIPRAIALDPPEGMVYWSYWRNGASGIYRSGMDGNHRTTLVSKKVGWINGIALDHTTNRLYWGDVRLSIIEFITLDGKTQKVLPTNEVFHPYSVAVFEDNLYWSDWKTFTLETCNKFTGDKSNVLFRENGKRIMGVHVYHPVLTTRTNNPCLSSSCSHMCLIAPLHEYRCVCPPGFNLASNEKTCLINDNFPMLLVNDDNSIYHIRPEAVGDSAVTELPTTHIELIGRLAYDWNSKTLYVTDMQRPAIYAFNMTTMIRQELVVNHLVSPEGLAFDSSNKNLYWVDSSKGTVEVVSTTTSASSTIIVDLSKPMDIVLVQNIGRMFVSTVGDDPSITMFDMDGKNAKLLNMVIATPVALAVHPTASLLYFADPKAETISFVDYLNPRSAQRILEIRVGNIISIAVNEKYLYWTDSKHNALNLLKLNASYAHTISLPGVKSGPVSRKVIYATAPLEKRSFGETTCANNNGGCSHLCLASPSGRSCSCAIGMELAKDGMTCKEIGGNKESSSSTQIYQFLKLVKMFIIDEAAEHKRGFDKQEIKVRNIEKYYLCINYYFS